MSLSDGNPWIDLGGSMLALNWPTTTTSILQADSLVNSIGVNIHVEDFGKSYDTYWSTLFGVGVVRTLVNTGIRWVRNGIEPPSGDSAGHQTTYYQRLTQVGSAGIGLSAATWDLNTIQQTAPASVATAVGTTVGVNDTITFAASNPLAGVSLGATVNNATTPSSIQANSTVIAKTATTIQMSQFVVGGTGVQLGDTINFFNAYPVANLTADCAALGSVTHIEGANEPDLAAGLQGQTPTSGWQVQTKAFASTLWNAIKANGSLSNVKVIGPSITGTGAGTELTGDLSPWCQYGNWHTYLNGLYPEHAVWNTYLADAAVVFHNLPIIPTEWGYTQSLGQQSITGAPVGIITRYLPRAFIYMLKSGCPLNHYYQMMANQTPNAADPQAGYGLINNDGTTTPMWNVVVNLISLFQDEGVSFAPLAFNWSMAGGNAATVTQMFQERNGTYLLAIWQSGSAWDFGYKVATTSAGTAAGTTPGVNNILTFASPPSGISIGQNVLDATFVGNVPSAAIPPGTVVNGTGATVTLSNFVVSPGVASGDVINFNTSFSVAPQAVTINLPGVTSVTTNVFNDDGSVTQTSHNVNNNQFPYTVTDNLTVITFAGLSPTSA